MNLLAENSSSTTHSTFSTSTASSKYPQIKKWITMMREFTEANREKCPTITNLRIRPTHTNESKKFATGSEYQGSWDNLRMNGCGVYTFPKGDPIYEGNFRAGDFHGRGRMIYKNGLIVKGTWRRGRAEDTWIDYARAVENREKDWDSSEYCRKNDRRFEIEYEKGLKPAGETYATNAETALEIPEGYYDVGDGLFNEKLGFVFRYEDLTRIIRWPNKLHQKWIVKNCRRGPMKSVGPSSLYEKWQTPDNNVIPIPTGFNFKPLKGLWNHPARNWYYPYKQSIINSTQELNSDSSSVSLQANDILGIKPYVVTFKKDGTTVKRLGKLKKNNYLE